MKIELQHIKIRDLIEGYVNDDEEGVFAFGGKLDIRPKYQRNFIYKPEQQRAVISTILRGFPLNVMYWVKNEGGRFEVLDGQQRSISICEFCESHTHCFDLDGNEQYFHSLPKTDREQILNYELMVYFCEGTDKEKLEWFKIVNIAGERLFPQEIRNAVYSGEWVTDAKSYFSKTNCVAEGIAKAYLSCKRERQEYLEKAIEWICDRDGIATIELYMAKNQREKSAEELWTYFESVINWVKTKFTNYRREMAGVEWGILYNKFGAKKFAPQDLEKTVSRLMADDDVTNKKGIYHYVFDGDERHLNLRAFTESQKRAAYERQGGICARCGEKFAFSQMEGDHILPWSKGGHTEPANLQMLCRKCNREKSGK